ncbi:transketolase [Exophiala oligosperma]|uniref:Transketolase n=1 Tax=Exophiala oligosperma TaxID=215243 RepID=A0A0D2DSK9_9EURO|nr:transketolase [Exophiala oligosperma]KIW38634.1 transketolase [Exophiala oligosperma]
MGSSLAAQKPDHPCPTGLTEQDLTSYPWNPSTDDDLAVLAVRSVVGDMCTQHGGGHAGSALGMAAIGVALWKYVMRYSPSEPEWFDRDRFVLSNGHASSFLYALLHLTGYEAWSVEQLRGYTHPKEKGYVTLAHGHPEIEAPGVEVTTGPLGQGVANAVGLAIASKNLAATFNEPDAEIIQARVFCMTGDGCLMEGVALEAISLAGQLQLDNLVLIYDNNQVTCDGPLSWVNNENINEKMRACGWEVIDVFDGRYDVQSIVAALEQAKSVTGKPVMVNVRTVIGVDTSVAGTNKAHHGLIDEGSIARLKQLLTSDGQPYSIPADIRSYFTERKEHGIQLLERWNALIDHYQKAYPDKARALEERIGGCQRSGEDVLKAMTAKDFRGKSTREMNGMVIESLLQALPGLIVGSADLAGANKTPQSEQTIFDSHNRRGRTIRYGVREHAMAAISNGLAAYHHGAFIPVTATFLMFYLYASPAARMGALSKLRVIHIATHDSFAEGQNGPTHQPVEVDSLYRAMPNLYFYRPCDGEEVIGAWQSSLAMPHSPAIISLARDPTDGEVPGTRRSGVARGAYVCVEVENPDLTIASCGSNMHHAVKAARMLERAKGLRVRVVSAPCLDLFEMQDQAYKSSVFPLDGHPVVSVEEYVPTVWARYVTGSVGMSSFGCSAANASNYERFQLNDRGIGRRILEYLMRGLQSLPVPK